MSRTASRHSKFSIEPSERLLNVVAEQIKMPLMQIAHRAELAQQLENDLMASLSQIESTASSAIKLLDNYLLCVSLAHNSQYLQLEPISISSVLASVAHELGNFASQNNCELELHLAGKYEPIMAHSIGLQAALTSLGYVFIEAQAGLDNIKRPVLKLGAHRSHGGIAAGIFADIEGLGANVYQRGRSLYGRARQPLNQISNSSGAGLFVADSLFNSMSAHLRVARHQRLCGLAATFAPSRQLEFI